MPPPFHFGSSGSSFSAIVFGSMLVEALRASANERAQRARGGIEPSGDVYRLMRVAYPGAFLAMFVEGALRGAPPSPVDARRAPLIFLAAKALKWWAIVSLGPFWTFRVIVVPGARLVAGGPYRWLRHPNYVGVMGELAGVALMTGAPLSGVAGIATFGALVIRRMSVEERALREAARWPRAASKDAAAAAYNAICDDVPGLSLPSGRRARVPRPPFVRHRSGASPAAAGRHAVPRRDPRPQRGPLRRGGRDDRQADPRDPNVAAVKARAAIARGRYAQAEALLRPVAARAPSSEAALELGLLQQMLGRPDADGAAREGRAARRHQRRSGRGRARRARAARARPLPRGQRRVPRRGRRRAQRRRRSRPRGASCSSRSTRTAEALKSFQMALQVDPRWTPALIGAARALADDNPPQATTLAKHGARDQSVVGRRADVPRRARPPTPTSTTRRGRRSRRRWR